MDRLVPVSSPCVGICELDERGRCTGCLRTLDEIARWGSMAHGERRHVMDVLIPLRDRGDA